MTTSSSPHVRPDSPWRDDGAPPWEQLRKMVTGGWAAITIHVVARLGVADLLVDGPRSAAELAEQTGTHEHTLYRFLRAAAALGVFAEREDGRFDLTPLGEYLRSDVPGTLRYIAYFFGETTVWNSYGHVMETLRTGEPMGPKLRGGRSWFDYLEDHPEYSEVFNKAMTTVGEAGVAKIAETYDFGRFSVVADLGGGQGRLLSAILQRYPDLKGVLFDIPAAVESAAELLEAHHVADRVERVPGSFFESVPAGADVYVMKAILHDWDDSDCVDILRRIRRALDDKPDGRLVLVECVVPPLNEWHYSKLMDISMLVNLGGKERTLEEWRTLLASAGFELTSAVRTAEPHYVIEGRPC
jgi:hypothetical protein